MTHSYRVWQRVSQAFHRLGGWPQRRIRGLLTSLFVVWILVDGHYLHLSSGLAHSTYDWMVQHRFRTSSPDPRIVIIDIDEASLASMAGDFGRWPWSRDTLASVLNYIEQQEPAAIVWDMLFSDPDRQSPGGDAAFDKAVAMSTRSHFAVVRLPAANDSASNITANALPSLWASRPEFPAKAVALIPPCFDSVAHSSLGLSNAYPDDDGITRRFRSFERLSDGSLLQSIPLSVQKGIQPRAWEDAVQKAKLPPEKADELIIWRDRTGRYPRIPFHVVFSATEGVRPTDALDFRGKIVIIGATAPTLHDFHPTALSAQQNGVDMLATLIDNTANGKHLHEIPLWGQIAIAIGLCMVFGVALPLTRLVLLNQAIVVLPSVLLFISYLSLQSEYLFLDLHLAAGWTLGFLAIVRLWAGLRLAYWQNLNTLADHGTFSALALRRTSPWHDASQSQLIEILENQAPECRVFFLSAGKTGGWPEAAQLAVIVGPGHQIIPLFSDPQQRASLGVLATASQEIPSRTDRADWLGYGLKAWQALCAIDPLRN